MDSLGHGKLWWSAEQFTSPQSLGTRDFGLLGSLPLPQKPGEKRLLFQARVQFKKCFLFSLNKNRGKCVLYHQQGRRAGTPASCPEETRKQKVLVTPLTERGRKCVNERDWARGGGEGDEKSIHKVWFI